MLNIKCRTTVDECRVAISLVTLQDDPERSVVVFRRFREKSTVPLAGTDKAVGIFV